jgi:hypothetical protein
MELLPAGFEASSKFAERAHGHSLKYSMLLFVKVTRIIIPVIARTPNPPIRPGQVYEFACAFLGSLNR